MEGTKRKVLLVTIFLILVGTVFVMVHEARNIFSGGRIRSQDLAVDTNHSQSDGGVKAISDSAPLLECRDGWQKYQQNVIGIAFCYPLVWGTPNTYYIGDITRLSQMKEDYAAQHVYDENAFDIVFDKNTAVRVRLFNDQYDGKMGDGTNDSYIYYESGVTDDVVDLKNSGDICGYKIMYDHGRDNRERLLRTVYSECSNGVRTVLTQDDDFGYTYKLKLLSFMKLANGYFDNALVSRSIDSVDQIQERIQTLDDFFSGGKTRSEVYVEGYPLTIVRKASDAPPLGTTKDQFEQERKEFVEFVGTMTAFKPIPKKRSKFQSVPGEDLDISIIRKYYWYIASGQLDEAYALYADKKGVSIDAFRARYGNAYSADPSGFKKVGDHRYAFQVAYRDHNAPEQEFNVTMNVNNGTIQTTFLEEVQSDVSSFGNMTAYTARRGKTNYIFLKKDGREILVDRGDAKYDDDNKNESEVKFFSNIKFSPFGNYLTYVMTG